MRAIRMINDIVFVVVVVVLAAFLGVNRFYLMSTPTVVAMPNFVVRSFNVVSSFELYLEMTILVAVMVILLVQWLLFRVAWAMRDSRRDRAETENVHLKAKLHELTEGERVDKIEAAIGEIRQLVTARISLAESLAQALETQSAQLAQALETQSARVVELSKSVAKAVPDREKR